MVHVLYINVKKKNVPFLTCAPKRRLKSVCASAQCNQSLRWSNKETASLAIQNAPSKESDQIVRTCRLIWIFAGRTCPKVHFLMYGSYDALFGELFCGYRTYVSINIKQVICTRLCTQLFKIIPLCILLHVTLGNGSLLLLVLLNTAYGSIRLRSCWNQ